MEGVIIVVVRSMDLLAGLAFACDRSNGVTGGGMPPSTPSQHPSIYVMHPSITHRHPNPPPTQLTALGRPGGARSLLLAHLFRPMTCFVGVVVSQRGLIERQGVKARGWDWNAEPSKQRSRVSLAVVRCRPAAPAAGERSLAAASVCRHPSPNRTQNGLPGPRFAWAGTPSRSNRTPNQPR